MSCVVVQRYWSLLDSCALLVNRVKPNKHLLYKTVSVTIFCLLEWSSERTPLGRVFPMTCPLSWEAGCNVIHSQRLRLQLRPLRLQPIQCGRTSSLWFLPRCPIQRSRLPLLLRTLPFLRRSILDSCALLVNRVNNTNLFYQNMKYVT
mgnify:FL=1